MHITDVLDYIGIILFTAIGLSCIFYMLYEFAIAIVVVILRSRSEIKFLQRLVNNYIQSHRERD